MPPLPKADKHLPHCTVAAGGIWIPLTDNIRDRVASFMLDSRTGKVLLNIRDGVVHNAVLEEHVRD